MSCGAWRWPDARARNHPRVFHPHSGPSRAPGAVAGMRGTAREAGRISPDQEFLVLGEVVRRFYRPMMQQHVGSTHSRSRINGHARRTVSCRSTRLAIAIAEAARVPRVCPLNEANAQCRGLAGGVLRFSPPYGVGAGEAGRDSALVYVRYTR